MRVGVSFFFLVLPKKRESFFKVENLTFSHKPGLKIVVKRFSTILRIKITNYVFLRSKRLPFFLSSLVVKKRIYPCMKGSFKVFLFLHFFGFILSLTVSFFKKNLLFIPNSFTFRLLNFSRCVF